MSPFIDYTLTGIVYKGIWYFAGLENHDSGVGIYAPDAEAYTTFADLFDPIIEDYHGGFKKTDKHPPKDFGDVGSFGDLDPAVSETLIHMAH